MPSARPDSAEQDDRSASPAETEWTNGLERLAVSLEADLRDVMSSAVREARGVVHALDRRGAQLLQQLDERRRAADEEQEGLQSRVAAVQADLEAVEDEIHQTRLQSEREAHEVLEAARRRADAIVADAEARAAEIVAAAHAEAAGRGGSSGRPLSLAGPGHHVDVEDRLRGLSARVGQLLQSQPPTAPEPAACEPESEPAHRTPVGESPVASQVADDVADETPTQVGTYGLGGHEDAEADDQYEVTSMPTGPDHGTASESREPYQPEPFVPMRDERRAEPDQLPSGPQRTEPSQLPTSSAWEREAEAPTPAHQAEPVAASSGPVTQTVIFQSVPNFQAALALERSLKAMADVREVRVADFDERQLTFQVTHELGDQLARVLLAQRGSELQLVEAHGDQIELAFRS
jgi:hypothetical protein